MKMLRNEALEKVESLEGMLDATQRVPSNGNGNALSIARQLVDLLKEEDLPEIETLEIVQNNLSCMKNITEVATVDPESQKAFFNELSRASYVYKGIEAALQWLVEEFEKQSKTKATFYTNEVSKSVEKGIGYLLFQCTKELLENAGQYRDAATVTVSLETSGNDILLRVEDDGKGFDTANTGALTMFTKKSGIAKIRERINYVKGNLYVESKTGEGTCVTMIVPARVTK
jgi:signal transduction histidine kinase